MWLINVVVILTFLFVITNIIERATKQKETYLYVILALAIIFEILFVSSIFLNINLHSFLQLLILIFSYLIPMVVVILNSADVVIRLKILYFIAQMAYDFKKYEFAAGLLQGAIKNDRNNIKFYYLRSKALKEMGDLSGARDMLFKVIELDRDNKENYLELAQVLDAENKKDTALVMLAHALKIDPSYTEAKEMMGIIYSEIGRDKEAMSIYEELATSNLGTYNTYYNLAIIYWRRNEIDKAIKAYNVAVGMNPKLYEAYYALGRLHFIQKNYEQSINNLEKTLKYDALKAKSEYILAQNYIKQKENEKAVEYIQDAIKQDVSYLKMAQENEIFEPIYLELQKIENEDKYETEKSKIETAK